MRSAMTSGERTVLLGRLCCGRWQPRHPKETFEMSVHFSGITAHRLPAKAQRSHAATHSRRGRRMRLTAELIARVGLPVPDPGPLPNRVYTVDADYTAAADELLAGRPANGEVWVFAYGSLIWKP